ncbi:GntR family transcriptional regulator [Microbacterium sp. JZ31]|uniref:GntR family transcriptional regulator n=1 Tax=Microbacterium sp. JZ31 TaxID=1906274 RepID=UPI001932A862|nr:GntR family transcriptional regulator [Microbacterium sp. JZ31]
MTSALDFTTPLTNRGPRLSDLAFERIADAIVTGVLAPGEVLRDHALAQQLGVSRMPVREALQRLERAGLVETAASRYTRVTVFTPARIAAGIEYSGLLYGSAMRLAVTRMTDEQQSRAVALLDELAGEETATGCLTVMSALYDLALTASDNEVLQRRSDVAYMIARIAHALPGEDVVRPIQRERPHLRDALDARDADAAENAVRRIHGIA